MATVMEELSSKWSTFTDEQKAGISEGIAGRQQAAVFQSLMSNFEVFKKAQSELNAGKMFNSAAQENEKFVNSIAGQLNKLKEIWVGVFNDLFDPGAFGAFLKAAIAVSEAIAKIVNALDEVGALTPILGILTASLGAKVITRMSGMGNVISGITTGIMSMGRVAPVVAGVEAATGGAALATTGFAATLGSLALPIAGIAIGLGAAVIAYDHFNESLDEEETRLNESIGTRKKEIKSIDDQIGKLKGLQKEYDTLANKPNKTTKEVERLAELTKDLAEIRPDLVVGYDENNNPILSMTGDVKDLIEEMDKAKESKERLLGVEEQDAAKNAIKQLHGSGITNENSPSAMYGNPDTEMGKLEHATSQHVVKMSELEAKRDKILNKLYESTGKERQKLLKDLEKADYNIEKQQTDFSQNYKQQLDVIQKYSKKIGDGVFDGLEGSQSYENLSEEVQKQFSSLKGVLDFSDIQTEDELLDVEMSLNKLMKAAGKGDVDLGKLKKSIESANKEFAKSEDIDKYNETIENLVEQVSEITGIDKDILTDIFAGLDTSVLKGKDALDSFLRSFGKTSADLENDDGFAKALATQRRHIEEGIELLNGVSGDAEVDLQLAYDIVNDKDLPEELRDMVRVLINKGKDPTEIIKVTQQIMMDLKDGKINIEEAQALIDKEFGKGAFTISPNINLSPEAKLAGIETVIQQINDRFGEIPPVVKTIIETDGVTSYKQAKEILELYNDFPPEVQTLIKNNGFETSKDLTIIDEMYKNLPPEVATKILTDFPDAISESQTYDEMLGKIPKVINTDINIKASQQVLDSVTTGLAELPVSRQVSIDIINGLATGNLEQVEIAIRSLPEEKQVQVRAAINEALDGINTVESKELKEKIAKLSADPNPAKKQISIIDRIKLGTKTATVTTSGADSAISKLDTIRNAKNKTLTVTIIEKVKKAVSGASKFFGFGSGNVSKTGSIEQAETQQPLSVSSSPSPAPMSTGASVVPVSPQVASSPAPMSTGVTSSSGINKGSIMPSFDFNVDMLRGMENELKKVNNQLEILDKKSKDAFGQEKINYLNKQNELYRQQQALQHEIAESMRKQQNELKYALSQKGFAFNSNGNVVNDDKKLLEMERYVQSLENKVNADKDGKNTKLKNEYESAKEQLEKTKDYLSEYIDLTFNGIPNCSNEWLELQGKIEEANLEIFKTKDALENLKIDIKIDKFSNDIEKTQREIARLDTQIDRAFGSDKQDLLNKRVVALKREQSELHNLANSYREQAKVIANTLNSRGFIIESDGDIGNLEQLEKFKDTALFDYLKEQIKEYNDLVSDKIPGLGASWWELENDIEDSYREQLKTAKEIEDKITQVYKKSVEDRKKLIDDELDKKLDALNKEKKAYNDSRKEMDYKDDYQEQSDTISELQKKIDIASKDTSLNGQKKLQELMKQMKEEQKKLQDLVQSNIDDQVNNMYDKELDRLKEQAEKEKETLDEIYSDESLKKIVDEALKSGVFVDIDGNVKDLQDTLVDFENKFGDGMTAIGGLIKSELITNLEIAKSTISDMNSILKELDLSQFSGYAAMSSFSQQRVNPSSSSSVATVQFNQPLVVVQGSVTEDVLPKLETMIKQAEKEITKNIVKSIK